MGLDASTLGRYIKAGKVPAPLETEVGGYRIRLWSEEDIERLRLTLPRIKNGRKTRYKKLREQQPQARVPVPHRPRKAKKKK